MMGKVQKLKHRLDIDGLTTFQEVRVKHVSIKHKPEETNLHSHNN
jgi:hypothetical protein